MRLNFWKRNKDNELKALLKLLKDLEQFYTDVNNWLEQNESELEKVLERAAGPIVWLLCSSALREKAFEKVAPQFTTAIKKAFLLGYYFAKKQIDVPEVFKRELDNK